MINTNVSMPHPVLGIPGDMEGDFKISFNLHIDRDKRKYIYKDIQTEVSNNYIKGLLDKGLLKKVIKISCIPTYKTWIFEDAVEIALPENEIDLLIEVESFLVCTQPISDFLDCSFNNLFGQQKFELEKGDIVGLTGSTKIPILKENEKVSLGSIFRFSKIQDTQEEQEIHFSLDEDQIVIYYPDSHSGYDPVTLLFDKSQGLPYTALNLFIIPALTEAFRYLEDERSEVDKRWCLVLNNLLPKNLRTNEPFMNAQRVLKTGLPINLAFEEILKTKKIKT